MNRKFEQKPEWSREALVVYGGLIGIGVVILQALIPAQHLDLPALISILAFAIALPLLTVMVLVNHRLASYRFASYPTYLTLVIALGQGGAFVGVIAAFWHISWIAAVLLLISSVVGLVVYAVYARQLVRDNLSETQSPSGG
jgi:membrane-associated HD superfamily phosphohydrolase